MGAGPEIQYATYDILTVAPIMAKAATQQIVRFRVDFSSNCSIGPGKIELLESIGRNGSLTQAARALGLSYRRARLLLNDLTRSFSEPVATARVGGNRRGSMTLTDVGQQVIRSYRSVARAIESIVRSQLREIATKAVSRSARGPSAPRKRIARRIRAVAGV